MNKIRGVAVAVFVIVVGLVFFNAIGGMEGICG
jgi:hypothetical protein